MISALIFLNGTSCCDNLKFNLKFWIHIIYTMSWVFEIWVYLRTNEISKMKELNEHVSIKHSAFKKLICGSYCQISLLASYTILIKKMENIRLYFLYFLFLCFFSHIWKTVDPMLSYMKSVNYSIYRLFY